MIGEKNMLNLSFTCTGTSHMWGFYSSNLSIKFCDNRYNRFLKKVCDRWLSALRIWSAYRTTLYEVACIIEGMASVDILADEARKRTLVSTVSD